VEQFSTSLESFQGAIGNEKLAESLNQLAQITGRPNQLLSWDEWRIAVPLTISVDVPPLGTFQDIDIRDSEPVVLVFDLEEYPNTAPMVFTDRTDFPKNMLAHLYIAKNGKPPAFCYVRGDRDGWYSNKRVQDLVIRIGNWLRDAAEGTLAQDGNQFEPLRLEGYSGVLIYNYYQIAEKVNEDKTLFPNEHLAIGLFELKSGEGFRLVKTIELGNVGEISEEISKDKAKSKTDPDRKHYRFGYFLWSEATDVFGDYDIALPSTWGEFKGFCSRYKISYESFENFYTQFDSTNYVRFPIIIAIRRPKVIIGFSSNIEFLNFQISINEGDVVEQKISDTVVVKLASHNQPLTIEKARKISGLSDDMDFSAAVFGCGALGSKIVLHLARCGMTRMTLVDPDSMSPHNLVRHALLPASEGQNKAKALKDIISRMYPDEQLEIHDWEFPNLFFKVDREYLDGIDLLFDFTASDSFFLRLVTTDLLNKIKVRSAYISDFGNLGILLQEGSNRNPRIDDLRIALYAHYDDISDVKNWLIREQETDQTNLTVSVGVGCNSETTVLSDDKVSLHAAICAGAIKKDVAMPDDGTGKILLSIIHEDDSYGVKTVPLVIRPLDVLPAVNDPSWSVRFTHGIINRTIAELKHAGQNETGGVFVGVVNYKTKTIHVTGLISAPADSKANSVCFLRGYHGLSDQVGVVEKGSGGQLGYVGEWHSHPHGPNGPSQTDMESVQKFKQEFNSLLSPLPVFLTIVTPDAILPYVF
jgi:hypothetical protein